jgi:hypothetical protein
MTAASSAAEAAAQFVRLGYADILDEDSEFRSLNFLTDGLSTSELQQAVRVIPEYNAFSGTAVAAAVEQFRGKVMEWNFGRDSSPVLYVSLAKSNAQVEKWSSDLPGLIPVDEQKATAAAIFKMFQQLGADEVAFTDENQDRIFAWWD